MDDPDIGNQQATLDDGKPLSAEEARQLVQRLRTLLDEGQSSHAVELLHQLHPVDQGEVLAQLSREPKLELVTSLPPEDMARILEYLEPREAVELSQELDPPALSHVLDEASRDVAADVLRHLPPERSQRVLDSMLEAQEVIPLLQYPDDTAGGLMDTNSPVVRESMTAANALDLIRLLGPSAENISFLFVIDDTRNLVGSVGMTKLALARPRTLIADLAQRVPISVSPDTDQERCARLMQRYGLAQLPVVEPSGRLVGVIPAEDMADVAEEEATEDMYKIVGIAGERVHGSLLGSVRHRLPWLYVNLGTAFLAALVINLFESTITKAVFLAMFLPVVAGQGGIGGTQTLTLVVRSMALGEISGHRGGRVLAREASLGIIHGLLLGLAVGLVSGLWKSNFALGLVLGLAMLGNMLIAGITGAGVPLLLRRLGIDPAVASVVIVTTFTDVLGFILFLGLAALLIDSLL